MIKVDVQGMTEALAELGDLSRKTPSIIARTLTEAAREGKKNVEGWLPRLIDRPTPWTKRGLILIDAKKEDLRAAVLFKVAGSKESRESAIANATAASSMQVQTYGGGRKLKASEKTLLANGITTSSRPYLIPTRHAPRDQYGNVTGGTMNKVLYSGVKRGSASQGYATPLNNRNFISSKKGQFFVLRGKGFNALPIGIAQNMGRGQMPRMMFMFGKSPVYKSRVPFDKMVETVTLRVMDKKFQESIDKVVEKYGYWR